jgi:hypothetical protein
MKIFDRYDGDYISISREFSELYNGNPEINGFVLVAFILLRVMNNPDYIITGLTRQETVNVYRRYFELVRDDINGIYWNTENHRFTTLSEIVNAWENYVSQDEYNNCFEDFFNACFCRENGTLECIKWRV